MTGSFDTQVAASATDHGVRGFAWVLNLDAEFELAQPSYNPPTRLTRQLAVYGAGARALLGPSDVLAHELPAHAAHAFVGRAWCPTPRALAQLHNLGVTPEPCPALEVVRRVNHRRFACELGGGLHDQHYVETRAALEQLLGRTGREWLLKRPLSFAGRGQLRVFRKLSAKEESWIDASLKRDGLVVVPLVQPLLELSLHGFVWPDGKSELGRICVQAVSERGVFRAVRLAQAGELSAAEVDQLSAHGARVATALAGAGYFGPFGIDAYRYRDGAELGFCALSEINARYTMGFVTGFPRAPTELRLTP